MWLHHKHCVCVCARFDRFLFWCVCRLEVAMANVKTDSHIDHALLRFHPTLRFERTDPNAISSSACSKAAAQSSVVSVAEDDGDDDGDDGRSREAPAAFVMPPPPGNRFAPIKDIAKLACFAEEARQHLLQPSSAEHVHHQHQQQHQHSHLLAFGRPKPPNTSSIMHHHPPPHPPRYTPLPIVFQRRWSSLVAPSPSFPSSSSSLRSLPALRAAAAARAQGLHLLCSGGSAHHHHRATVRMPNLVCLQYTTTTAPCHHYQIGERRPLLLLSQQNKSCFVRKINRLL